MRRRTTNPSLLTCAVKPVVEQLERRFLMAFQAFVNFQPAASPVVAGYLVDGGAAFGNRGNGFTYGWNADNALNARDRNAANSPDQRYDTLTHTQVGGAFTWEMAVPNGQYQIRVVAGDPGFFNSVYKFNVESTPVIDATPTTTNRWIDNTVQVAVSDGRLTLSNAAGSVNNKVAFIEVTEVTPGPVVLATRPFNGETNVVRDVFVAADLMLPNAGIDNDTLNSNTVFLRRASDGQIVPAVVNTSGGGDTIVLQPVDLLEANTGYTFEVTTGLRDLTGAAFAPFTMSFTTGTAGGTVDPTLAFEKLPQATSSGSAYTALTKGPDGKLYAGTVDGRIIRFPINADGTLGTAETITSLQTASGGPRLLTGIEFDPASTANNLILWASHGFFEFENAPDWSGKISKLTGPSLATVQDIVVGLPRSIRDHLNNQIDFGPDGKLYFLQGSNTAMGAPDTAWGLRPERMLNSTVLRLDPSLLAPGVPLNVKTEDGGTYDPFAVDAPLTIYAAGVRNAYDLVWTTGGQLYVPTNGSAAGGATPGFPNAIAGRRLDDPNHGPYAGPDVPALNPVTATQNDYLFRVEQGGYYGHPNPHHGTYVLNGGNPTSGVDPAEVIQYPVGTLPDVNWRGSAFDFGKNVSPNGIIEYQGDAFGGALQGRLLVVRFSGGDDVIVLTPGANGNIIDAKTNVLGMQGFFNPVDIAQDAATGFLYVAEFGPEGPGTGGQRITLLRPVESSAVPAYEQGAAPDHLVVSEAENNDGNFAQGGKNWVTNSTAGFSGSGALQAMPNSGTNQNTGFVANSPRLDFTINFTQTGTHHVWVRGFAPSGSDDTVHVGLDGQAVSTSDRMSGFTPGAWTWSKSTLDGAVATINVTSPGLHTLNVWMREDGFIVDKVLLTTNASFIPTGTGPAQSPRSGPAAPLAPTNLDATVISPTRVDLTWTDNSTDEIGFKVFRKQGSGGTYQLIHTAAANATSYSDTSASPGTQYFYHVVAEGSTIDSFASNEDSVTTPHFPPAAPDDLAAAAQSSSAVTLTWDDNSNNESGFKIFRKQGAGGTYQLIHTTAAGVETYADSGLTPATQYFYQVFATNSGGDSTGSNEASATTLAVVTSAFQQGAGPDHLIVAEAENNDGVINQGGKTWSANNTAGFSGAGARQATPNTGVNQNTGYTTQSPRMDFRMNFTQTGVHHVWIRGFAPSGGDDTVHAGLDGIGLSSSDRISGFAAGVWTWSKATLNNGPVATINVTTPGIHTLNIWMREDGFIVDKVLVTTNANFTPTGTGPAESPRDDGTPTAPAAPSNLTVTGASPTQVALAWQDNSNNETGFKIMRKQGAGGTYGLIHTTAAGVTSYTDLAVAVNTTYFYKVIATNGTGDSPESNEVSASTTLVAPSAPTSLNATPVSSSSVNLTWNDTSGNEDGFNIYRKTGSGGTYVLIFTTGPNVTSYLNGDLDAETEYVYQVASFNDAGESLSNEDAATTPAVAAALTSIDINTPTPGSTTELLAGSDYDITASGLDIWSTADAFRFAYKQVTGDFDVRVQVTDFNVADATAKAGLMARDSTAAGSRNVLAALTGGNQFRFSSRSSTNGTTSNTFSGGTAPADVWLRLRRVGSVFTAFQSADGVNWAQLGQITRTMNATLLLGLAANSKSSTATADVEFRSLGNVSTVPVAATINWVDGVDAPLAVQEGPSIQVGNKLFVMGGYQQGLLATRAAHVLNLDTMTWSAIADIPNAQTHVGVATDGQFIYLVGGQIGDGGSTDITAQAWKYDIANNTWQPFTALPEPRIGGALAYLDGKLYYFGGNISDRVTVSNSHWAIPTDESTGWVARAPLINPGDHIAGVAMNGKVYAVGGEHGHGSTYNQHDALSEYDPSTNTWVSRAPMPAASSHFESGLLVVHGRLVVLGGMIDNQLVISDVRAWDPQTNTWSPLTSLPLTRKGGAAAFYNDQFIYTAGRGSNPSGGLVYSDETWVGQVTGGWWQGGSGSSLQSMTFGSGSENDKLLVPDDDSWNIGPGDPPSHEPTCCCGGCLGSITMTYTGGGSFAR